MFVCIYSKNFYFLTIIICSEHFAFYYIILIINWYKNRKIKLYTNDIEFCDLLDLRVDLILKVDNDNTRFLVLVITYWLPNWFNCVNKYCLCKALFCKIYVSWSNKNVYDILWSLYHFLWLHLMFFELWNTM